jgi:hypothetical protein
MEKCSYFFISISNFPNFYQTRFSLNFNITLLEVTMKLFEIIEISSLPFTISKAKLQLDHLRIDKIIAIITKLTKSYDETVILQLKVRNLTCYMNIC